MDKAQKGIASPQSLGLVQLRCQWLAARCEPCFFRAKSGRAPVASGAKPRVSRRLPIAICHEALTVVPARLQPFVRVRLGELPGSSARYALRPSHGCDSALDRDHLGVPGAATANWCLLALR